MRVSEDRRIVTSIKDIFIIDSNTAKAEPSPSGTVRTLCSADLCGAKTLTVYRRAVLPGRQLDFAAGNGYHLVYVISASSPGVVRYRGEPRAAAEGAGVLLAPGESTRFEASGSNIDLLQMIVPKPPAAIEQGLAGGPGYFFDRTTLRGLSDASGGRVRRFCAESSVKLLDGSRLTLTNAIQAGEMHYNDGGASPYHSHSGTAANPSGADHCYMTFKGRGRVEVEGDTRDIEPGTLVYFPPGVPHRLRALGGPLDYFEIQAWRSFKTSVLSEEPLGLRWYYERERPGAELVEWNQS
jgi:mannose-6-phosphate isomerase-like protein (cupin superfamily)